MSGNEPNSESIFFWSGDNLILRETGQVIGEVGEAKIYGAQAWSPKSQRWDGNLTFWPTRAFAMADVERRAKGSLL